VKIGAHWHYTPEKYVAQIRRDDGTHAERVVIDDSAEWLTAGAFRHPLAPELCQPDAQIREMNRQGIDLVAFTFVHPSAVLGSDRLCSYYLTNPIGNPVDTSVAIASLIFGDVFDEFLRLTCCFAHGSGVLPAIAGRWQHGHQVRPEPRSIATRPPLEYLDRIYVDRLTRSDHTRRLALELLGDDHAPQ
jgi:hypothetical protein